MTSIDDLLNNSGKSLSQNSYSVVLNQSLVSASSSSSSSSSLISGSPSTDYTNSITQKIQTFYNCIITDISSDTLSKLILLNGTGSFFNFLQIKASLYGVFYKTTRVDYKIL